MTSVIKLETRHSLVGYLGGEFPVIYNNRCGVTESLNLEIVADFLRFFGKQPLTAKFSEFCSQCFIATLIDVLCSNCVKFGLREVGEIVRCLTDKKTTKICLALALSLLRG